MIELQEVFEITYGNSLDLNKLKKTKFGINFVSRTSKNNGVSAQVEEILTEEKMPYGSISVSLGGSVLEAFIQPKDFYTGYHIFCLREKIRLSDAQKLYYCVCIRANKYKYSYGRQANRTLKSLLVPSPEEIPSWVNDFNSNQFKGAEQPKLKGRNELQINKKYASIEELFSIKNGVAATGLEECNNQFSSAVMYIRPASTQSRTLRSYIDRASVSDDKIFPKGTLFVSTNGEGSHSYSYVSTCEIVPNSDVSVLIPKREMSLEEKLFYAQCITANRYLFSYGRKPKGKKLKAIKVPVLNDAEIKKVRAFINALPFSSSI
jgi:hypothetical protein